MVNRHWLAVSLCLLGIVAFIAMVAYLSQPEAAFGMPAPISGFSPAAPAVPATATPVPLAEPPVLPPGIPAPGQALFTLTPQAEEVGWSSSLDGRYHPGFPNIHAGFFDGHVYQGGLKFDLSLIPPGANLTYASLALTALDGQRLGQTGVWQLGLLDPLINSSWPYGLTYDRLQEAGLTSLILPALTPVELVHSQTHLFTFSQDQLTLLERYLAGGEVSFRLDGPQAGDNSLFTWDSGYRGAEELGTGPVLYIAAALPPTPTYVLVTSTTTPENIVTAAALAAQATDVAQRIGTYTPAPANWVTPVVVTPIPTPANTATAAYQLAAATAEAFLFGTPTPTPPNVWTATPGAVDPGSFGAAVPASSATPTPIFILLEGELATPWATWTPTATPPPIPAGLVGKIAFLSNRSGGPEPLKEPLVYVIDPDGRNLAVLTDRAMYDAALARDSYSTDQRFRAFVKNAVRFDGKKVPALYFYDYFYQVEEQVTHQGAGIAYDPAWSPSREQIAFVSNDSGSDEIWVINRDGSGALQLTRDEYGWWDKHPSWSPDGSQLVFWSNRTGNRQIWVMNADGSQAYSLSRTGYDDWDPVWLKYTDPVRN